MNLEGVNNRKYITMAKTNKNKKHKQCSTKYYTKNYTMYQHEPLLQTILIIKTPW